MSDAIYQRDLMLEIRATNKRLDLMAKALQDIAASANVVAEAAEIIKAQREAGR
jgi:hypothetical protein